LRIISGLHRAAFVAESLPLPFGFDRRVLGTAIVGPFNRFQRQPIEQLADALKSLLVLRDSRSSGNEQSVALGCASIRTRSWAGHGAIPSRAGAPTPTGWLPAWGRQRRERPDCPS